MALWCQKLVYCMGYMIEPISHMLSESICRNMYLVCRNEETTLPMRLSLCFFWLEHSHFARVLKERMKSGGNSWHLLVVLEGVVLFAFFPSPCGSNIVELDVLILRFLSSIVIGEVLPLTHTIPNCWVVDSSSFPTDVTMHRGEPHESYYLLNLHEALDFFSWLLARERVFSLDNWYRRIQNFLHPRCLWIYHI